ncbi:tetratricopeptide repeat protein 1-like [Xyrauchen texanus]|uniref:tetratricopeptide repeat protein 1-like n=1 Tax=Xyrauchen texanus TaxID=154827 RepID=UPI002241BED4|nr:tetratricopeptide repeat protein 1-like [Xyrauchen texanus]XP_051955535.1 tetratricopeptide repeat protein 1-like [Xyrauchen texanus]
MEREMETHSATMANTLQVSVTRKNTTDKEEDCFYDCEDTLSVEDTLLAGYTDMKHTEMSQSDRLDSDARTEKDNSETERLGNIDAPDRSCLDNTSAADFGNEDRLAEKRHYSLANDPGFGEDQNEEQEKWERLAEDYEKMDSDSDSEFKETVKVTEYDEENLRELEKDLTEEEKESRRKESIELKEKGNTQFKSGEHVEAEESYTAALQVCPVCYSKERSILFSNRAAARLHLDKMQDAIRDCSKAIELNPNYVRAILRRAELYEKTDKLDEALEDYKTVFEKDPSIPAAREACMRLPQQIEERNEKLKEEMMSKLKDLGNMILRPFGLSTSNFHVNRDANTGSYSVNFVQNPNNNNR